MTVNWSGSLWDEADLVSRVCRALSVAKTTLSVFGSQGYLDQDNPDLSFGPEKPVAEVAMLLYAASACSAPEIREQARELALLLAGLARSERVLLEVALNPSFVFKFALPHILLTRLGYTDSEFDCAVKSAAGSQLRTGVDRPPSALLEGLWISEIWTGSSNEHLLRRESRKSLLSHPLSILTSRREQVYALTHIMFYVSDFGFSSASLPRNRGRLAGQSRSLLARFLEAEDYDLSAELLLTWPFMGVRWDAASSFAFRVLAAAESAAGMLPCGNVDLQRLSTLSGAEQSRYALGRSYHTALVMGLLCATLLRPSWRPPVGPTGLKFGREVLKETVSFIADAQGYWLVEFHKLDVSQQIALIPFLVEIAIAQQVRQKNYAELGRILMFSQRRGVSGSPMLTEASDQLLRLARVTERLGSNGRADKATDAQPHCS
jgi:hypothetical protein